MVVYTYHRVKGRSTRDEYWKLENHKSEGVSDLKKLLRERKYYFLTSSDKNRLLKLLSRQARGLLSYGSCSTQQLSRFCIDRGLLKPTKSHPPKAFKIRLLEDADEKATFAGFSELPPEIRLEIYSFYFGSLPELIQPTQPPIARTSQAVRAESLSIFYKICNFVLDRGLPETYSTKHTRPGISYLKFLTETHLSMIRRLSIVTSFFSGEVVEWDDSMAKAVARNGEEETQPCPLSTALIRHLSSVQAAPHGTGLTRADVAEIGKLMAGGAFQLSS